MMKNRWRDFHSALSPAQVRLLYPPGIRPSPKVNISQQCLLCSTPHLPSQKKKKEFGEKRKDLEGTVKRPEGQRIQIGTANVLCRQGNQKVVSRRRPRAGGGTRTPQTGHWPTPPSEMFVWTRAMNPWLLKGGDGGAEGLLLQS